jgi:hypothetical protein
MKGSCAVQALRLQHVLCEFVTPAKERSRELLWLAAISRYVHRAAQPYTPMPCHSHHHNTAM